MYTQGRWNASDDGWVATGSQRLSTVSANDMTAEGDQDNVEHLQARQPLKFLRAIGGSVSMTCESSQWQRLISIVDSVAS